MNKKAKPADSKRSKLRRRFGIRKIILSVGFILMVTIIGTLLFSVISDKGEDSAANQIKSVLSNDEIKEYRSPDNGFSIDMPGFPSIERKTYKDSGRDIPLTIYERRLENGSVVYAFEVNDYSGINLDQKKALEIKMNERIQSIPGAKLISSQAGFYNSLNAIEAHYSFNEDNKDYEARVRFIFKDSKIYAATLIGGDQAKFEAFTNSLRFD